MLALTPRTKKKPAAQMQQDQQQVAEPVALQQTKQKPPAPQQGLAPRPAGAPPTPPREAAPLVKAASSGAGAAPAPGSTLAPAAPAAGGLVGRTPTVAPGYGSAAGSGAQGSFGAEQIQGEKDRQAEIDRQRKEEENRIAVEEGRREAASEQQQRGENVFTDINKSTSNDTLDQQIRGLIENIVSGKGASTKSEEDLIKQLMEDRIGAGLVEQRARMGRAGFGASGALAAMEGDVRRQAAQGATQETLAVRRQAEQDAINQALQAIGVDVSKRKAAADEIYQQEYLNAIKSALGQSADNETQKTGGAAGEILTGIQNAVMGPETQVASAPEGASEQAKEDYAVGGKYNPIAVNSNKPPPENATQIYNRPDGGVMYAVEENGKTVWYVYYKYATK